MVEPHIHLADGSSSTLQILTEPDIHENQRNKCSVILQKLCGACCLLPDSYIISDGLELTGDYPVAHGGFADVYQGTYKGRAVAVKTLRLTQASEQELLRIKKVRKSLLRS